MTHTYNRLSHYQRAGNFFIGIGPIWFGSFIIFILTKKLFPQLLTSIAINSNGSFLESSWQMVTSSVSGFAAFFAKENYTNWATYVWLYLVLSIGFHLTLSKPDLDGAKSGLWSLGLAIFVINLATAWMEHPLLLRLGDFRTAYSVLFFTLSLVIVFTLIALGLVSFKRAKQ